MADARKYETMDITAAEIGTEIELFLRNAKRLVTQGIETENGYFVQAKGKDTWKAIAGMDMATQIQCTQLEDGVLVEVGTGKWSDKIGAGAVGLILFAPLAVTAAVGAWGQKKLPSEIYEHVNMFIMGGGVHLVPDDGMPTGQGLDSEFSSPVTPARTSSRKCPRCGAVIRDGMKFCANCGAHLVINCPNCNTELELGTRFCPECGTALAAKKVCANCGSELEESSKFCPECGTPCD